LGDEIRDLTPREYEQFRKFVYEQCGINLGPEKQQLLRARLGKRLRQGGYKTYQQYFEHVQRDQSGEELACLIDAVSTNTTHLFRENKHFEFLGKLLRGWSNRNGPDYRSEVRIWSAGCSSGEEPYSIAMTAADALGPAPASKLRILATDISTRVLAKARQGLFAKDRLAQVPPAYRSRFFKPIGKGEQREFQVIDAIGGMITFDRFNLMSPKFTFANPFDVIFCRNVMIYFDRETVTALVARYASVLRRGGYLIIGHSESLNNLTHSLTYVMPTIYQKP
jgi:chemotaxis protein methyltransferase CheR